MPELTIRSDEFEVELSSNPKLSLLGGLDSVLPDPTLVDDPSPKPKRFWLGDAIESESGTAAFGSPKELREELPNPRESDECDKSSSSCRFFAGGRSKVEVPVDDEPTDEVNCDWESFEGDL